MLDGNYVVALGIIAVAAVVMYLTYMLNQPDPERMQRQKEREEAERVERTETAIRNDAQKEKDRAFALEMAKLGYVQKSVLKRQTSEQHGDEDTYGTLEDTTREWMAIWVKDEPKGPASAFDS